MSNELFMSKLCSKIVDLGTDGILVLDVESNRPLLANRSLCRQLGLSFEEIRAFKIDEPAAPTSLRGLHQCLQEAAATEGNSLREVVCPYLHPSPGYWDVDLFKVELDSRPILIGVIRDVTEHRLRLEAETAEKAFSQAVIKRTAEGLCVCSDVVEFPFVEFTVWNDRMTEITGYTMEEINRLGWYQTLYPDETVMNRVRRRMDEMREGRDLRGEEWTIRHADGQERILAISTAVFTDREGIPRVLGLMQDVTNRSMVERRNRQLAEAVEHSAEAIMVTDPEGVIQYVNPAFTNISGFSAEEAIGSTPSILESGAHNKDFYDRIWERIAKGETWKGRFVNRRKDQRLFHEEATISPVFDDAGNIVNYVAVKRDVTSEVMLEEQVMQTQKLEGIGRLAGSVAHEFNNILTAILGYSECILLTAEPTSPYLADVEEIRSAAERASALTKQLTSIASKRSITLRTAIVLNDLIEESDELLSRFLGEGVSLEYEFGPDLWPVLVDEDQLTLILRILVENACDAMPDGGRLVLRTENIPPKKPTLSDSPPPMEGECVMLSVTDTGSGIKESVRGQIFEPFFSTKPEGTGLGLSTLHGIVRQNEGHVTFESAEGKGTVFRIFFPCARRNG